MAEKEPEGYPVYIIGEAEFTEGLEAGKDV